MPPPRPEMIASVANPTMSKRRERATAPPRSPLATTPVTSTILKIVSASQITSPILARGRNGDSPRHRRGLSWSSVGDQPSLAMMPFSVSEGRMTAEVLSASGRK